jgi:hypothetical protein
VSLTVSPWPRADPLGRLRFAQDGEQEVAVTVEHLQAFLYADRLDRVPRIGDVFAARVETDALDAAGHPLADRGAASRPRRTRMLSLPRCGRPLWVWGWSTPPTNYGAPSGE